VYDRHLINGIPVAETEIGRDPRCPVRESRLSVLLAAQSRFPVGRVCLEFVENGIDGIAQRVRILLDRGCRHIAFDAWQTAHLDAVASLINQEFTDILLVGSAGLAGSLVRMMTQTFRRPERPQIHKWLFVCGSASRVLAEQVAVLSRSMGWTNLVMEPSDLKLANGDFSWTPVLPKRTDASDADGLILSIKPILDTGPAQDPNQVVRALAEAAVRLLPALTPDGVFLSGGDTAAAFWCAIEARSLLIREEILPGLVLGDFIGGPYHGLPVVTKAGAFGRPDTLTQLIHFLD